MKSFLLFPGLLFFVFCLAQKAGAQSDQTVGNGEPTAPINFPGTGCTYNWVNNSPGIGLAASGSGNIPSFIPVNNGASPVTATITATPEPTGFAYIANYGDGTVSVINTVTNTVVATIPVGASPVGVVAITNFARIFVTSTNANLMTVINPVSNIASGGSPTGPGPYGVLESPDGRCEYVANSGSNSVSVIYNLPANPVTIPVGTAPKGLALSPDGTMLYVTNSGSSSVSAINTSTNLVMATIPMNAPPLGIAASPDGKMVYVTNAGSSGTVSVISTATNSVVSSFEVDKSPVGIAVTQDNSLLYVANSGSNDVSVVNTKNGNTITTVPVGLFPFGISITPDGSHVYVTNENSGTVSVISTLTNAVTATITVGTKPTSFGNFIIGTGTGCSSFPVTVKITVNPGLPPPILAAGAASGNILACAGAASADPDIQQFTVSATNLTANITATAPPGFEVSLSPGGGYGGSVSIAKTGSTLSSAAVYVRSALSSTPGAITGNITLASPGAKSIEVPVSGAINPLPTINPVTSQTVTNGQATAVVKFTGTTNTFNWVNDTPGIGLATSGTGDIASFTAVNTGSTPVTATITATPAFSNFAYVANFGSGTVSVINSTTNAIVATVQAGLKPFAVCVSPDGSTVYITNAYANTVTVLSTSTNTVLSTIPVGSTPAGISISPDGKQVYVVNSFSNSVSVINTSTNKVTGTIIVGKNPQGIAISPDGSTVYVANSSSNNISVINTTSNTEVSIVAVGLSPSSVLVSPDGSTMFVTNSSSNTVSVITAATNTLIATIPVGENPHGLAISPDGSQLYVTNNVSNTVSVISTQSNSVAGTIAVGQNPYGLSITPNGSFLYVANANSGDVSVISTATNAVISTIPVGSEPDSFGSFISQGSTGCTGAPVKFTITVKPSPVSALITADGMPAPLSTIYGTPSTSTIFTVSGIKMEMGILVTPPTGFVVSIDDINFKSTVTIGSAGTIGSATVYIRLASSTPVGNYSGDIVLSSTGAANVEVIMPLSTVTPAPLTITADNKTKAYGTPNPVLTASYTGFKNSDTYFNLTTPPVLTTTATVTSPVGQYPITASGASSPNYTIINYFPGTLTVLIGEQSLVIPNTFTPNGDGINDTWNIQLLNTYANCSVNVFNRWGEKVYSSTGYAVPWDGTYKGTALPTGTYYYIINLKNGLTPLSGFVALIR